MADLGSDPGFQSFLRTLSSRRTLIEAEKKRRLAALLARRDIEMAEFDVLEEQEGEKVDDLFEERGMFRAGGRLEDRADVIQRFNAQRARSEFNLAEDQAAATRQAASELAGLSTLRAQEEMAARQRISDREFALAQQARAERLAAQERADWQAEQVRLQGLYDRQHAATMAALSAARTQPAVRSFTPTPTARAPVSTTSWKSSRGSTSTGSTRTTPRRTLNWTSAVL